MRLFTMLVLFVSAAAPATAASNRDRCLRACRTMIASCTVEEQFALAHTLPRSGTVAAGRKLRNCRTDILRQCKRDGAQACASETRLQRSTDAGAVLAAATDQLREVMAEASSRGSDPTWRYAWKNAVRRKRRAEIAFLRTRPPAGDTSGDDQVLRDQVHAQRKVTDCMLRVGFEGVEAGRCNEEMKRAVRETSGNAR